MLMEESILRSLENEPKYALTQEVEMGAGFKG